MVPADAPPHVEFLQYGTPPVAADAARYPGERPAWQTTLLVDDVQAAADALRSAGVRFVSPDVATISETALGFSRAVMVRDPDGLAMRLVQR